jgi:hypothetical protein
VKATPPEASREKDYQEYEQYEEPDIDIRSQTVKDQTRRKSNGYGK